MLLNFAVGNFRSFSDEQTLNTFVSAETPRTVESVITTALPNVDCYSLIGICGHNAFGKSNFLLAIRTLCNFVKTSVRNIPDSLIDTDPFKMDVKYQTEPTTFDISFIADGVRYRYILSFTKERIIEEDLECSSKCVYRRLWNNETNQYDWSFSDTFVKKKLSQIVKWTRPNVAFLSSVVDNNNLLFASAYNWFCKMVNVITLEDSFGNPAQTINEIEKGKTQHDRINTLLRDADLGIGDVVLHPYNIMFTHQDNYKRIDIDFDKVSMGTRRYFFLIGHLLHVLDNGGVLCIDDLDVCLHPALVRKIIWMFRSRYNHKGAQLIFTTHNEHLLKILLRTSQIWVTDKKDNRTILQKIKVNYTGVW
jgi:AAA15 family ATPase/GTPase